MRDFIENLKFKFQMWMQGRCGLDELSKVMLIISAIFFILSNVLHLFYYAAALLMICACGRIISTNIAARRNELSAYYRLKGKLSLKLSRIFSLQKRMWNDRKTHRYFKCKNCGAILRVPKGKGKIDITCTVCKTKITKRT